MSVQWALRRVAAGAAIGTVAAGAVFVLAYMLDPEHIGDMILEPYALMSIDQDGIEEVYTVNERREGRWRLLFNVRVTEKRFACDQVAVTKTLQRQDDPQPFAFEQNPTHEVVKREQVPAVVRSMIALPAPLPEGSYALTMRNFCFGLTPEGTLRQRAQPATSSVCFVVRPNARQGDQIILDPTPCT